MVADSLTGPGFSKKIESQQTTHDKNTKSDFNVLIVFPPHPFAVGYCLEPFIIFIVIIDGYITIKK